MRVNEEGSEATERRPIRVFHCDDSAGWLALVRHWLLDHPEIEHVGGAATRAAAHARLPDARPDVILLDTMHPEVMRVGDLRGLAPGASVVVYSAHADSVAATLVPDADAYVEKRDDEDALVAAIARLAGGG